MIPNGAGEDEFLMENNYEIRKRLHIPNDNFLILHVGSHTGLKGHKEIMEIFDQANIANATLLIVGNFISNNINLFQKIKQLFIPLKYWFKKEAPNCPDLCRYYQIKFNLRKANRKNRKKIIIKNFNRDQTIAAYHAANLFLFPSQIECSPLVLFEAMASKTPFLTTNVGNSAEIIKWTNAGLLLPTIGMDNGYVKAEVNESAKILEELIKNNELLERLASNGFRCWQESFTWEIISNKYEQLYLNLINV